MKIQQWINQHKKMIVWLSGILIVLAFAGQKGLGLAWGYSAFMIPASIIGAVPIAINAYQALKVKVVSIDLLVTIAVVGAFLIKEYNESAIVTFLFLFGSLLEQRTLEKTRSAIQDLTKMAPASALVIRGGETEKVDIDEVEAGDLLLVKTGAQVPVDGIIEAGSGYLNEASVTGEAVPAKKANGAKVFAGTMLENGTLKVRAEKVGEDTTFGKIIELVEEAQDSQSSAERFIDKFAKYYTPLVLLLAATIGIATQDVRLAITILVLGCPGALVIGVPVSNVAGIGNGAKHGVLLKGGEVLDTFSIVDTMVFDKTGTLTNGTPTVAVVEKIQAAEEGLALAASIERESDHPLGKAIIDYAALEHYAAVTETEVVKGQGIKAAADGKHVLIGNPLLLKENGIALTSQQHKRAAVLEKQGNSLVYVALDGKLSVIIGIKDQVRVGVKETLQQLKKLGVKNLIMLSGDQQSTAEYVANQIGITEVHGNLLPEQKVEKVKELKAAGHTVAFVGDGINDSPSIATADIGIAMGGGTDVAIDTSDVVLMKSDFRQLSYALDLTKRTVKNMKENILIAIGTVLFLLLGLVYGYIYMASGMLVHELSILVVVFNGMRLLAFHQKKTKLDTNQVQFAAKDLH